MTRSPGRRPEAPSSSSAAGLRHHAREELLSPIADAYARGRARLERKEDGPFQPADFGPSSHWTAYRGNAHASIYMRWAANEANRVIRDLASGRSRLDTLVDVARSRRALEHLLQLAGLGARDPDWHRMGQFRADNTWDLVAQTGRDTETATETGAGTDADAPTVARARAQADRARQAWNVQWLPWVAALPLEPPPLEPAPRGLQAHEANHPIDRHVLQERWLPLRTRAAFHCGHLERVSIAGGARLYYVVNRADSIEPLLADSFDRLDLALTSDSTRLRRLLLATSARAYFKSMPFQRGSAAVGRSFWAAAFSIAFGRKVILPADIDVAALIPNAPEYNRWLLAHLEPQLPPSSGRDAAS